VRLEHQVVAHPERIEAEALGEHGALEHCPTAGVFAEVRHEQSESHRHVVWSLCSSSSVFMGVKVFIEMFE
jgi:hypothetical protein